MQVVYIAVRDVNLVPEPVTLINSEEVDISYLIFIFAFKTWKLWKEVMIHLFATCYTVIKIHAQGPVARNYIVSELILLPLSRGTQTFQSSRSHPKILGVKRLT
jgi:hypothetical protein